MSTLLLQQYLCVEGGNEERGEEGREVEVGRRREGEEGRRRREVGYTTTIYCHSIYYISTTMNHTTVLPMQGLTSAESTQ